MRTPTESLGGPRLTDAVEFIFDGCGLFDAWRGGVFDLFPTAAARALIALPVWDGHPCAAIPEGDRQGLIAAGAEVVDLPGDSFLKACALRRRYPTLSPQECFSFLLLRNNAVLVLGDPLTRQAAAAESLPHCGVEWLVERMLARSRIDLAIVAACRDRCARLDALAGLHDVLKRHLGGRRQREKSGEA